MKHCLLITLFGIGLISITGCYTQIAIQNEYKGEEQPGFPDPEPDPCLCMPLDPPPAPDPPPIYIPPEQPIKERPYKTRNPQIDRSGYSKDRGSIRNTGGRNDLTEGGKGRIKDTGGRNNLTERGKGRR